VHQTQAGLTDEIKKSCTDSDLIRQLVQSQKPSFLILHREFTDEPSRHEGVCGYRYNPPLSRVKGGDKKGGALTARTDSKK
jgi:hypothetical protein